MPAINLSMIPRDRDVSIFMRHAERFEIKSMKDALEIPLTEKGESDALDLGKELTFLKDVRLCHSPVARCRVTAEMIGRGLQGAGIATGELESIPVLGGPYITGKWGDVIKSVEDLGHDAFIRAWFEGTIESSIIMPLREAASLQVDFIRDHLEAGTGSSINVTHDWNILLLREQYFSITHEDAGMPDFMDGLVLFKDGNRFIMRYADREITIP